MAISDKTRALFDTKALGMLGVVRDDGTAQVTPVWIMLDGDTPVVQHGRRPPKERHMRRDPRVTLTIVDPDDAYSYVELRGRVEFEEGQVAFDTIDALAKKYIDQDTYPWNRPGDVRVNLRLRRRARARNGDERSSRYASDCASPLSTAPTGRCATRGCGPTSTAPTRSSRGITSTRCSATPTVRTSSAGACSPRSRRRPSACISARSSPATPTATRICSPTWRARSITSPAAG